MARRRFLLKSFWPPNKQVVQVYDYVDIHIPTLMRMYKKRLKGYDAIGYLVQNSQEDQGEEPDGSLHRAGQTSYIKLELDED